MKVWLALRQAGREGYVQLFRDDIARIRALSELTDRHPEFQAFTCNLSIATFRYVPADLKGETEAVEDYLNRLNTEILERLQAGGEVFVSNAVIEGKYLLRACSVNFRTKLADIEAIPGIIARVGRETDRALRPETLG